MTTGTPSPPPIRVELGDRSYSILVERGILSRVGPLLRDSTSARRTLIVTDTNVAALYREPLLSSLAGAGFSSTSFLVQAGESSKSISELARLCEALSDFRLERSEPVLAVGGGVVGDLAGLAAATYLRGVPIVHLPTTLMAQVDSSIGGKTGVNLPQGKNLVGAIHQPEAVYCDPDLLRSLEEADFLSGLAEVVKYGIIRDAALFRLLEERADRIVDREPSVLLEMIVRCATIKAAIVSEDERETRGLRLILNLGHTIGHALEALDRYAGLRHGEAVAIGIAYACRLAVRTGRLKEADASRITGLLERLRLPVAPPALDREKFIEHLRQDKKVDGGNVRFVLPTRIGEVLVDAVPESEILGCLADFSD